MAVPARKQRLSVPFDYDKYLRPGKLPHIWCPGCGHGVVLKSLIRAIDRTGWKKDDICMVSGIGCSSRTTGYVDFNTIHSLHGRAFAFATGVKFANPQLNTIVISGDGDAMAIGGNHFIHLCRRNIDITVLIYSNAIYGMTGGQYSPTTPEGSIATTSRYGNIEPPFDPCEMAKAAGATFVARSTAYHTKELEKILFEALAHKGTSVIDVIDSCPVYYGRMNKFRSASEMMNVLEKDGTIPLAQAEKLSPEELKGRKPRGILHRAERPEYCENYEKHIVAKATGG